MFTGVGLLAFVCICCAVCAGHLLGRKLPEDSRSDASQKVLQSATGIVGILTALVLGLMIANSKANFDTTNNEFEQFAANLSLLDGDLARVGVEFLRAARGAARVHRQEDRDDLAGRSSTRAHAAGLRHRPSAR